MKKIKLFAILLAVGLITLNSSFTVRKTFTNYQCFGVINKTSWWPGIWRYTLINLDCYYVWDYGCVIGWSDCIVCIDPWQANIIYNDGCILTLEIPWQDTFVEQPGEFIYEIN
jgi:hypothetical protein